MPARAHGMGMGTGTGMGMGSLGSLGCTHWGWPSGPAPLSVAQWAWLIRLVILYGPYLSQTSSMHAMMVML